MLRQSRASAGAYTARLDASGADVGGTVAVTLSVLDGHGRPAAGLPVTLAMAGADPSPRSRGTTAGRSAGSPPTPAAGRTSRPTVGSVPDHRLHVWPAETEGPGRCGRGRRPPQVVVSTRGAGARSADAGADGRPRASSWSARRRGSSPRSPATACRAASAAALHGPFASAGAATAPDVASARCRPTVAADGDLRPAARRPGARWLLRVAGGRRRDGHEPAGRRRAGRPVKVRGRTSVSVSARPGSGSTWQRPRSR